MNRFRIMACGMLLAAAGCSALPPAEDSAANSDRLVVADFTREAAPANLKVKPSVTVAAAPDNGLLVSIPALTPEERWPGIILSTARLPQRDFSHFPTLLLDIAPEQGDNFSMEIALYNSAGEAGYAKIQPGDAQTAERQVVVVNLDEIAIDKHDIREIHLFHSQVPEPIRYELYQVFLQGKDLGEQLAGQMTLLEQIAATAAVAPDLRKTAADKLQELKGSRELLFTAGETGRAAFRTLLNDTGDWLKANETAYYAALCPPELVTVDHTPAPRHRQDSRGREMQLVWQDEFDGSGLPDPSKWNYEVGFVRNGERQFYTEAREKNVRQENGYLLIQSHKESLPLPEGQPLRGEGWPATIEYTSGSITTHRLASWSAGRIEVRAMLPGGRGIWPAIWLLGENIDTAGYPACGEIDIMEYVGYEPERIYGTVHIAGSPNPYPLTSRGDSIFVERPDLTYHVYAVEWDRDGLRLFVDDQQYFEYSSEQALQLTNGTPWPFNLPQYLILNTAVGGSWGGAQGIDDSIFPADYKIDYVRVYEPVAAQP